MVTTYRLSFAQRALLRRLHRAGGGDFLRRNEIRMARRLEALGLAKIEDHGHMPDPFTNRGSDGERYMATLELAGVGVATHLVGECDCPEHAVNRGSAAEAN